MLANKPKTDNRVNPRVPIKIPIKYRLFESEHILRGIEEWHKAEKNGFTLDVSLSGMYIVVDQSLNVGEIIKFDIFLLDKRRSISVYAEVTRVDQRGAGLHFLMMINDERETLKSFLEKITSN